MVMQTDQVFQNFQLYSHRIITWQREAYNACSSCESNKRYSVLLDSISPHWDQQRFKAYFRWRINKIPFAFSSSFPSRRRLEVFTKRIKVVWVLCECSASVCVLEFAGEDYDVSYGFLRVTFWTRLSSRNFSFPDESDIVFFAYNSKCLVWDFRRIFISFTIFSWSFIIFHNI